MAGGKIFKKNFGRATGVRAKSQIDKRNIVTDSDLAIETTIRRHLSRAFPGHLILGEEFGGKTQIQKGEHLWILDPIDGTNNFAQGIPLACISIGLWNYKGPLAAVVYNPITKEMYTALRGQGAHLNSKSIRVSKTKDPMRAVGALGWSKSYKKSSGIKLYRRAFDRFGKARAFGTTTMQMCFVADGRLDFYFAQGIYIWDMAAAALIVQEAGGKVSEIGGAPIGPNSRSVIASNNNFHNYIIKNLR